ncbi:hypothetical protein ON010_g7303 [Phytophthora cinnamomi]|nr:hypothetical protein ON010_g7303 [Phytophthora cinnamomi]
MEKKRRKVQATEAERVQALKTWQQHRHEWKPTEAAKRLGVHKSTLLGWRNELSDRELSFVREPRLDPGGKRKKGAGPDRQLQPYEDRVLEFYTNSLRDGGSYETETPS